MKNNIAFRKSLKENYKLHVVIILMNDFSKSLKADAGFPKNAIVYRIENGTGSTYTFEPILSTAAKRPINPTIVIVIPRSSLLETNNSLKRKRH